MDTQGQANLTVEVLSRQEPSPSQRVVSVRVRLVGRNETRQFQGESRTWENAAELVADVIRRFVNESF